MSRWDIAKWVGPTPNRTVNGMVESRGLVLHIMQGTYDGSIAWGKNPASSVSFHFATRGDGHLGQLVDTADTAWTQANGNGHWISVENEGYSGNPLTPAQVDACAHVYAEGVRAYGWPLQTTDSPNGYGLGWHGMGGTAWGGHFDCPGEPIKAQRDEILGRAAAILNPPEEEDMTPEQARQLYNLDRLNTALLLDADEVTLLDDGAGNKVSYPLMVVKRQKAIFAALGSAPGGLLVQHTHDLGDSGPAESV